MLVIMLVLKKMDVDLFYRNILIKNLQKIL
jgi:hypothetical protein